MTLHDLEFLDMEAFSIEKDLTYYLYCSTQHGLAVKIFHVSPEKKYELLDIDAINSFIKKTKLENEIIQRFPIFFKKTVKELIVFITIPQR